MIDLLGIVRAKEFSEDLDTEIRITDNKTYPYIQYKSNNEVWTIDDLDIPLAKASDLEYLLKTRAWNTPERKFIDSEKNLCFLKETGDLDYILTIDPETSQKVIANSVSPDTDLVQDDITIEVINEENKINYITPTERIRKILSRINQIEQEKSITTEDTLYNILLKNKDKLSKGSIEIICKGSSIYTNIVNLNHYVNTIDQQKILVKLGISYSKQNSEVINTYYKNISFIPFNFAYNAEKEVYEAISDNFIKKINNDITIEYINGCIRLFSINPDVIECIIDFCYLNEL